MRTLTLLLVLASLLAAPLAASGASSADPSTSWASGRASEADLTASLEGAVVCGLGDVNGDGAADLLLRTKSEAGARLQALAGPAHTQTLWTTTLDASARLRCAPDLAADGVADALVELREKAASSVPDASAPVSSAEARAKLHAVSGATGEAFVALEAAESTRGGEAAGAASGTATAVALNAGGSGLLLYVSRETTHASAGLPLGDLSLSSEEARVRIEVLDATGQVVGTIEAPDAKSEILSHASLVDAAGEARILLLSVTQASPIDEAPAQVPTVSTHAPDGSLLWSVDLEATTQKVILVPDAGDLDADGVRDLIVESVPSNVDVSGSARSTVTALSGADGKTLLALASEAGLLAALPLGDITPDVSGDADALLTIAHDGGTGPLMVACLREGVSCWKAQLPADAIPVNGATDVFTGDLGAFHDLTGDGIPDLATLSGTGDATTLQVLNGLDGAVAWSVSVAAGAQVEAIPGAGGADLAVLALAEDASSFEISAIGGEDGVVSWTAKADIAAALDEPELDLSVAKDASAKAATLFVTVRDAKADADALVAEHAYAVDAQTGATVWSGTTLEGDAAPPELLSVASASTARGVADVPAPGGLLVVAAVGALAVAMRRVRRS